MELFVIVPIFITVIFVVVIGSIAYQAITGLGEWSHNNSLPVQEMPAQVVSKRTEVSGRRSSHSHSHGRIRTHYFATFELKSGERAEFGISGSEYGLLVEGDQGMLAYQGTRYHGFQRRI